MLVHTPIIVIDDSADWNNDEECCLGAGEPYKRISGNLVAGMGVERNNETV